MRRRRIEYGITALILAFFVGLVALNYFAVAALTLGAIISWPAIRLIQFIGRGRTRILWTAIIILIVSNLSLFALFWSQRVGRTVQASLIANFASPISLTINRYYLTIESSNWRSGVFRIRERVDFDPKWAEYYQIPSSIDLPEREVTSADIGLLTREVRIDPLKAISSGYAIITLSDGRMLRAYICFTCGDTIVLGEYTLTSSIGSIIPQYGGRYGKNGQQNHQGVLVAGFLACIRACLG